MAWQGLMTTYILWLSVNAWQRFPQVASKHRGYCLSSTPLLGVTVVEDPLSPFFDVCLEGNLLGSSGADGVTASPLVFAAMLVSSCLCVD